MSVPSTSCPIPSRLGHSEDWSSQLPDSYSQTPGGTLFSTTPGGTRIIYDRKFLLECRSSPIARTPPSCLPHIRGVTLPHLGKLQEQDETSRHLAGDDDQFVIDF